MPGFQSTAQRAMAQPPRRYADGGLVDDFNAQMEQQRMARRQSGLAEAAQASAWSESEAQRAMQQMPDEPQAFADGGPVGFGARGLAGLRDLVPKMAAMGYPQAAAPAPAPAADPRGAAGLRAMIPQVEAMGYKQASAPAPQYFARGGVVRGPGTGTSDSIETEAEPGTFIMPADSTEAIGPSALEQMGTMPVRLSDGEYQMPPEQVMAIGEAVLKLMKDATHAPVNGVDGGQTDAELAEPAGFAPSAQEQLAAPPEQRFADGGLIDPARRPNSFGDAAAAAQNPGTMQVNTGGADTFGRAPAPAPAAPAGLPSAATRMASTGDPTNPYAASNAAVMSNFANQQGSRGVLEMGRAPAPQPATASNSFGDAAAATVDPRTTQVTYTPGTAPSTLVARAPAASAVGQPAGFAASARMASPAPAPAAPMGWAERNAQRNASVSAASITNRPEWSRTPAGLQPRRYADGGLVEEEQRRLAQIPTGGQVAPVADGSQSNPLNTELGRNAMNTLAALPGAGTPARAGAAVARGAGNVATAERAIPATWEVVQEGGALANRAAAPAAQQLGQIPGAVGGPLARAANMAPQQAAPALAGPGGQLATQPVGLASRGAAQMAEAAPAAAGAGQAAGAGLGRYATTGAAGMGAAAMLAGATPDTGAAPTQPAGFAPNALAAPAAAPPSAAAAMSQPPSAPAGITRTGNSYTGPANITGDVTINGAAPGGGAISAQNMGAADALAGRQAQESAARVLGQMPAGFQGAAVEPPVVRHSGNSWQERNDLRNALVSAQSITNNGSQWDRNRGESAASQTYRAMLGNDIAARGAVPKLAGEAMAQNSETNRATLRERSLAAQGAANRENDLNRTLITERGNNSRAGIAANATLGAAQLKADLKNGKEGQQQVKDTQDIFSILKEARPLMATATGSYGGVAMDKVAQTFGGTTQGAEATAKLQALQGALISKMPKMSGPQSDKDVQLYREMAGQIGDATIPTKMREAAMDTIENLNMKYLPSAADEAAYRAIPAGSYYRNPNGEVRRKN